MTTPPMKRMEGRVAFITGGGAGIGAESALQFSREGAKIIIADLDERTVVAAALVAGAGALVADWAVPAFVVSTVVVPSSLKAANKVMAARAGSRRVRVTA